MKLAYKAAIPSDITLGLDILQQAAIRLQNAGVDQWSYWLDPPPYKMKWLEDGFAESQYHFVYIQEELVGMYRLSATDLDYWGEQAVVARYIHSLVVLPRFSGQHIGREIIRDVEEDLRLQNINLLRLDCHAGNERLCAYYEQLGFEKVGEKRMPHSLNNLYEKSLT